MKSAPEPLSWLTLERYALGELSAVEHAEVEARLAASESDRACLAEILADVSELPPLVGVPAASAASAQNVAPVRLADARARARQKRQWLPWSLGLCAAAAALLLVLREPPAERGARPDAFGDHVKGADVTLRLHSDRYGSDPSSFSSGERFKVEVTCPPSLSGALRLVVLQGDALFEPLPRSASFRCGNLAAWPGAFALDGSQAADVCMYWGASERPTQEDLARAGSCTRLLPP